MAFEPVQFGKYTLYEKLAVGGMAIIYRARVQGVKGFQKDLVIKQILPQYSGMNDFIDMFIDEAKIAVNLNHANIVPVYELGETDGQLYIAMEYVAGRDLASILEACEEKKASVPPRIAAYILIGVARGLDYAHNKKDEVTRTPLNIIHRDISPNNVIVSHEGEVKIIDFGIAKASIKVSVTQFGTLKGKMIYMSPEQAAEGKLDPRSDVFSAGILLYELVTGKKPYGGDNFAVTQENVKKASFPPPDKLNPALPPAMTSVILKAMARDPNDRFASAFEFERALSDYLFSTGSQVYARDVAQFLSDLFSGSPSQATTGLRDLTDSRAPRPELTPTDRDAPSSPSSITTPGVDGSSSPVPAERPSEASTSGSMLVPEEGVAIEESSYGPAAESAPLKPESQRDTVVSRLPDRRAVPASPAQSITPPPVGRDGVVPVAARSAEPTRTTPSKGQPAIPQPSVTNPMPIPSWLDVSPVPEKGRKPGIVPAPSGEEETAPGGSSPPTTRPASGRPSPSPTPISRRAAVPPSVAARSQNTPSGGIQKGPPPPPPAPRASPSSIARQVQAPPANPSGKSQTPRVGSRASSAGQEEEGKAGLLDRVMGRKPASSAGPSLGVADTVLEGSYESPQDFLTNSYQVWEGKRRGLFLTTTQLDAKLGVDIPLDILFRSPTAEFRVHGRVIWRRAKEGTSKGKRLPAGLAIEFVEGIDDDLEALFAYLGLP